MRPADPQTLTAWSCGGEVMALGGDLSLRTRDGEPSTGCRRLTIEEAYAALLAHITGARTAEAPADRAYHLRHHNDLAAAILSVEQWRKAA